MEPKHLLTEYSTSKKLDSYIIKLYTDFDYLGDVCVFSVIFDSKRGTFFGFTNKRKLINLEQHVSTIPSLSEFEDSDFMTMLSIRLGNYEKFDALMCDEEDEEIKSDYEEQRNFYRRVFFRELDGPEYLKLIGKLYENLMSYYFSVKDAIYARIKPESIPSICKEKNTLKALKVLSDVDSSIVDVGFNAKTSGKLYENAYEATIIVELNDKKYKISYTRNDFKGEYIYYVNLKEDKPKSVKYVFLSEFKVEHKDIYNENCFYNAIKAVMLSSDKNFFSILELPSYKDANKWIHTIFNILNTYSVNDIALSMTSKLLEE